MHISRVLLASDFDGTLSSGGGIALQTVQAVAALRARGGLFGICSGREPGSLEGELRRFGVETDFRICMNGAIIEVGGERLREQPLMGCAEALPLLAERCQFFTVLGEGEIFIQKAPDGDKGLSAGEAAFVRAIERAYAVRSSPDALRRVYQISCRLVDRNAAVALAARLQKAGFTAFPNCEYVDIVPSGVNKAEAVAFVARQLGVPDTRVYTVGDGRNDMGMLSRFRGFAMAGAEDCVRRAAKRVVDSVGEAARIVWEENGL